MYGDFILLKDVLLVLKTLGNTSLYKEINKFVTNYNKNAVCLNSLEVSHDE